MTDPGNDRTGPAASGPAPVSISSTIGDDIQSTTSTHELATPEIRSECAGPCELLEMERLCPPCYRLAADARRECYRRAGRPVPPTNVIDQAVRIALTELFGEPAGACQMCGRAPCPVCVAGWDAGTRALLEGMFSSAEMDGDRWEAAVSETDQWEREISAWEAA